MARLVQKPATPYWLGRFGRVGSTLSFWQFIKRSLGFPATDAAAVLAQLVSALKVEAEVALPSRIAIVTVTAPWVAVWNDDIPADNAVNDALVLAALEPGI